MGGVCVDVSPQCLSLEAYSDRARKVWRMTGNECEVTCKRCLRMIGQDGVACGCDKCSVVLEHVEDWCKPEMRDPARPYCREPETCNGPCRRDPACNS